MEQNDKPRPTIPTKEDSYYLKYSPDKSFNAFVILALSLVILIPGGAFYKQNKIQKEAITIDCKLLSRSFKGSTLEINPVPVVGMGMNGGANVGVGLATSGHGKEYISSFDCGDYGILISDDKEIFRQAKEDNKLTVYFGYNDYKILGI